MCALVTVCALQLVVASLANHGQLLVAAQPVASHWAQVPGQVLANAAEAFGMLKVDLNYSIPPATIVELRNSTFRSAPGPEAYSKGTFSIAGGSAISMSYPSSNSNQTSQPLYVASSVLDAGMRAALVPPKTSVQLTDVALINMCWTDLPVYSLHMNSPVVVGLFSLYPTMLTLRLERVLFYFPHSTLAFHIYAVMLSRSPPQWTTVLDIYSAQLNGIGVFGTSVTRFTSAYEFNLHSMLIATMIGTDVGLRSLDAPNDPLLTYMRAQGMMLPPTWCSNGSLVPEHVANAPLDRIWGPVWLVDTPEAALQALVNVTALAAEQQAANHPVAAVALFLPSLALTQAALPAGQLSAPLLLWGPFNDR